MSEELEWELFEIFESGIFVFPIYEHNSARRIVHYLLMRGILDEEIAEAIEDSTIDLHLWLNRVQGKFMVGEWVIAWMNECREEYEKERGCDEHSLCYADSISREFTPESMSHTNTNDDYGDDFGKDQDEAEPEARSESRVTDIGSISSHAATASTMTTAERDQGIDADFLEKVPSLPPSPSAGGPRGLMFRHIRNENGELPKHGRPNRPANLEFLKESLVLCDGLYMDPPDSGNVSDIYTTIPPDQCIGSYLSKDSCFINSTNVKITISEKGLPVCPNCTCAFTHYSYCNKQRRRSDGSEDEDITNENSENKEMHEIYSKDPCVRAMELTFETLDKDGPGFIFILTDSKHSTLSWSVEHCYKIGSSRQPERCVAEFRTQEIEVDLIWKVKVRYHLQAISEVHEHLYKYNVHSNWFKCSLSVIMDVVSKTVRQYKI